METLLITGHSGFIGSHLVEHLSKNYKIIGISKTKLKNKNIVQSTQNINNLSLKNIPKQISHIIHLAALTDVEYCQKNPKKCFEINVNGTHNLLEICRKKDLKFTFLSTSHVFGYPTILPLNEFHPRHPTSIYASSKLCGEVLCESFSKTYGLDISVVRLFSIYGPHSPTHLVTTKIIYQLLTKNIIKLGNLTSKRDFLYIDDVKEALSIILKKTKGFETFNVGSGESHSILELFTILKKISKSKVIIKSDKSVLRKNDIPEIVSDSTKLQNLGWKPKTSLYDGLTLTYNSYKKIFSKH